MGDREQLLDSNKRGTGARYNEGKPPVELLDIMTVALHMDPPEHADPESAALFALGVWQESGGKDENALHDAIEYLVQDLGHFWWLETAKVLGAGARKYRPWNWAKGMPWSVPLGCAVRHLLAALGSDTAVPVDSETGRPHRAHALCNLMFLARYMREYHEGNDLYTPPPEDAE